MRARRRRTATRIPAAKAILKRTDRTIRSAQGVSAEDVRRFILDLPAVEAGRSYGLPAFMVSGRFLARFRDDDSVLVIRLSAIADRDVLTRLDAKAFFFTEHYRDHPAVLVRLAAVRWGLLVEVLEAARLHVAAAEAVRTPQGAEAQETDRRR